MAPSMLSLAASSALLASALAQTDAACVASSLTLPSWYIQNVTYTPGTLSVHVLNRATEYSALVECGSSNGTRSCSSKNQSKSTNGRINADVKLVGKTAELLIDETWTCSGKNASSVVPFEASGNTSVPLNCTGEGNTLSCKSASSIPALIKASLLQPVRITPAYVPGPSGHASEGCSAAAQTPKWELDGTQVNRRSRENPDGKVVSVSESILVMVNNPVTGNIAGCSGYINVTQTGLQRMDCQPVAPVRRPSKYRIQTEAFYDAQNATVTVNESWFCDDLDPAKPVQVKATGTVKVPFDCQDFRDENNPSPEFTTFCTSGGEIVPFTGTLLSSEALPPYSLTDPLPSQDSCTVASIVSPAWRLGDLSLTIGDRSTFGAFGLGIELQAGSSLASQFPTIINHGRVPLDQPRWLPCDFTPGDGVGPTECAFLYDHQKKTFSLNSDWVCNELDAENPITFSGVTETTVPGVKCETLPLSTECNNGRTKWTANITSVTWRSTGEQRTE